MILRRVVICLGLSQLISWGVSYYLIGAFGDRIAADLAWSREIIYGGFSIALLVMGLSSSPIGRLIDHRGGRTAMIVGALFNAAGCLALAAVHQLPLYVLAWILLGLGMRLTLYDAAFAVLARIGGPAARRPMSQITLLGGLASTVFWPAGNYLADAFGWRVALLAYAVIALLTIPLHLTLPIARYGEHPQSGHTIANPPLAPDGRQRFVAAGLYTLIVTLTNFLNFGMSAHMVAILTGLGMGAGAAVNTAAFRGIGQSAARLCEVLFGRRLHPLSLNVVSTAILPLSFFAGLFVSVNWLAAVAFVFFYGAGNGLSSIARGTVPLALFDHRTYGSFVGRLIAPSFLISAAAPVAYATVMSAYGERGALVLSTGVAMATVLAAITLKVMFGEATRRARVLAPMAAFSKKLVHAIGATVETIRDSERFRHKVRRGRQEAGQD